MNVLDVLIVAAAVPAGIGGYRLGLAARASSWLGLALGFLMAAKVAPTVVDWFGDAGSTRQLVVAALVLVALGLVGQMAGLLAGARMRLVLPHGPARVTDRVLGSLTGVGGVVVACWLLLPVISDVPDWPSEQVEGSLVAGVVDGSLPDPPDTLHGLRSVVGEERWAAVVRDSAHSLDDLAAPPAVVELEPEVEQLVRQSVVFIEGNACGQRLSGTGFVVGEDLIMTAAHVVAGVENHYVSWETERGRSSSIVAKLVHFDSRLDVALLFAPGVGAAPLSFGSSADRTDGLAFGHPGTKSSAEPPTIGLRPFRTGWVEEIDAFDIYTPKKTDVERDAVVVAARLEPGFSGGPLVDTDGNVVGMAFAVVKDKKARPFVALAHTSDKMSEVVDDMIAKKPSWPTMTLSKTDCIGEP